MTLLETPPSLLPQSEQEANLDEAVKRARETLRYYRYHRMIEINERYKITTAEQQICDRSNKPTEEDFGHTEEEHHNYKDISVTEDIESQLLSEHHRLVLDPLHPSHSAPQATDEMLNKNMRNDLDESIKNNNCHEDCSSSSSTASNSTISENLSTKNVIILNERQKMVKSMMKSNKHNNKLVVVPTNNVGNKNKNKRSKNDANEGIVTSYEDNVTTNDSNNSFAILDDELRFLQNNTVSSDTAYSKASTRLLNDLKQSEISVRKLEHELEKACTLRDSCIKRHNMAEQKREKELEITAVQTIHLEILCEYISPNNNARQLLLNDDGDGEGILSQYRKRQQRYYQNLQSQDKNKNNCTKNFRRSRENDDIHRKFVVGDSSSSSSPISCYQQSMQSTTQQQQLLPSMLNSSFASTQPGRIIPGIPNSIKQVTIATDGNHKEREVHVENNKSGCSDDPYENKSVEELRVIKNRLMIIKELFEKASSLSPQKHEGENEEDNNEEKQVRIENATSKYILFWNRNLV